jgi:multicomponent Na+:H+ antiporter subunit G
MSQLSVIVAWVFMLAGAVFFVTGALGLLRFPDVYSRLHAVTKTDTLGLGLLTVGLALKSGSPGTALMLFVIWLLVLASGAVNCQLLARYNLDMEVHTASADEQNRQGATHDV